MSYIVAAIALANKEQDDTQTRLDDLKEKAGTTVSINRAEID